MGSGIALTRAFRKYGKENFTKEILYSNIQYKETADDMEIYAIAKERSLGKAEYNISKGGTGGDLSMFWTEEGKAKLKEIAHRPKSEHCRQAMSKAKMGVPNPHTKDQNEKIGLTRKGKHWWTNGETNVFRTDCPAGYWAGYIKWNSKKRRKNY